MTNYYLKKENTVIKFFEPRYRAFLKRMAKVNGVTYKELIEFSNSDDEIRKNLEKKFFKILDLEWKEQA